MGYNRKLQYMMEKQGPVCICFQTHAGGSKISLPALWTNLLWWKC